MTRDTNIVQLFINAAQTSGANAAFIDANTSVSYNDLLTDVKKKAYEYDKLGIKAGSSVLVMLPISIELYKTVLALFYIGACPVFLDEWVNVNRLRACCRLIPCDAMIASQKILFLSFFIKELRKIKIRTTPKKSLNNIGDILPYSTNENDTALITFTTGTTGIPKAANRTHGYLYAQYDALKPTVDNGTKTSLVTLPIVILINLALGKTTLLPPTKVHQLKAIPALAELIKMQDPEEIITSPAILNDIADSLANYKNGLNTKSILSGGGPVFPDLAKKVLSVFPEADSSVVYGSTEAEPISKVEMKAVAEQEFHDVIDNGLLVGKLDENVGLAIMPITTKPIPDIANEDEFKSITVDTTQVGEIVVNGPHVLRAYINNPTAIARHKIIVANNIWHRTGDAGKVDNSGRLHLLGNCAQIINHNDTAYYPIIIEYAFKHLAGSSATILYIENKASLIIESDTNRLNNKQSTAIEQLSLEDFDIYFVKQIPRDKRHRTKVNYQKLQGLLLHKVSMI